MDEQRAQRTLVKSPPELWAEISDLDALTRHLGEFGDICITRAEPETAVAWEGDRARGTVELEPAGWGTKVTLTAVPVGRLAAAAEPAGADPPVAEPVAADAGPPLAQAEPVPAEPEAEAEPEADPGVTRRGLWARLVARWRRPPEQPEPPEPPEPSQAHEPPAQQPSRAERRREAPPRPAAERPPGPGAADPDRTAAILVEVLDDLGAARHRPFSRMG